MSIWMQVNSWKVMPGNTELRKWIREGRSTTTHTHTSGMSTGDHLGHLCWEAWSRQTLKGRPATSHWLRVLAGALTPGLWACPARRWPAAEQTRRERRRVDVSVGFRWVGLPTLRAPAQSTWVTLGTTVLFGTACAPYWGRFSSLDFKNQPVQGNWQ